MKMKLNDQQLRQIRARVFGTELRESVAVREVRDTILGTDALREARVDRRQSRIQDVALLGRVSKNNRIYTDQALRDAARLYEGVGAYLDHPARGELEARDGIRSTRDLIGKIENPRVAGDRVRGDLVLLETGARSLVLSLAESAPELAGFSHRAKGDVRLDEDGRQIVESISHVFAMELVTEPATVGGLQESAAERGDRRDFAPVTGEVILEASRSLF